jgi:2-oxoisovalerate dehydrogenase E1 component
MPQSQFVDPNNARAAGKLEFQPIPLNQYAVPFKEAAKEYTKADLLGIYRDMSVIREFETMLYSVRTTKQYNNIPYAYTGPAHLYSGQEAAGVVWPIRLTGTT